MENKENNNPDFDEWVGANMLKDWFDDENRDFEGLFRDQNGNWWFDRRRRIRGPSYEAYGARTFDINSIGPNRVRIPDEVCRAFGLPLTSEE